MRVGSNQAEVIAGRWSQAGNGSLHRDGRSAASRTRGSCIRAISGRGPVLKVVSYFRRGPSLADCAIQSCSRRGNRGRASSCYARRRILRWRSWRSLSLQRCTNNQGCNETRQNVETIPTVHTLAGARHLPLESKLCKPDV